MSARVEGAVAFVTGANRGIGRAFVEQLLEGGAARIYAGMRDGAATDLADRDGRIHPVSLDVTDRSQVEAAATACGDVDLLINNAGYHARTRLVLTDDPDAARREMEVNYFGVLNMTRAFAPILGGNGGGAIVNVLSVAGAMPSPFMGGYSPAKSAALFLSTISRAELEPQGTTVTALIVGSVDTRMADHVVGPKENPSDIARVGLAAMERGERVTDTDQRALRARAMYALDPARYERAQAKILHATTLRTT
ncbi:SDR family oxidoreductase [Streptosporangium sp. NPDC087985]|uniref:SDR family oxidoreductase n=1 Tax=Streptosporangium sp. NPDC087985 TaxID=3366196 RepID=UPI0038100A77